jgi:hypothetical protein
MAQKTSMLAILALSACLLVFVGCGKPVSETAKTPPAQEETAQPTTSRSPLSKFESDLQFVRNGQYTYVWVFSRKDGKQLNKEDADYLRKNAPQVVDWVGTDEGKRFIGGTNFNLEEGNLELLRKRFVVEDYSSR